MYTESMTLHAMYFLYHTVGTNFESLWSCVCVCAASLAVHTSVASHASTHHAGEREVSQVTAGRYLLKGHGGLIKCR